MNLLTPANKKLYQLTKDVPVLLNEGRVFTIYTTPPTRVNSTQYFLDDIIILSTFDTKMYKCVKSGTSSSTPPTFSGVLNSIVIDGSAQWACLEYSALLLPTRTVTSVTLSPPAEVTISSNTSNTTSFTFKLNYPTGPIKDFTVVADITSSISSVPEVFKANLYFNTYTP